MNLDGLKRDAERRLKRIERAVALDVLSGNLDRAEKRRFRCLMRLDVALYLQTGELVEMHQKLFPARDDRYLSGGIERRFLRWQEWTLCRVDTIGLGVRLLVPGQGRMLWVSADFIRAALTGHVRPPAGAEATPPRCDSWIERGGRKVRRRR